MLQKSKVIQSRNDWREKAVRRANEVRELSVIKKRHQQRIAELKAQVSAMKQANIKKNTSVPLRQFPLSISQKLRRSAHFVSC